MERYPQIREILKKRLWSAQERRVAAARKFEEATKFPSRIPHTCESLAVRKASQEYSRAIADVQKAMQEHNDFIIRDVIPDDLRDDQASAAGR